jgi:hypothetical protein
MPKCKTCGTTTRLSNKALRKLLREDELNPTHGPGLTIDDSCAVIRELLAARKVVAAARGVVDGYGFADVRSKIVKALDAYAKAGK